MCLCVFLKVCVCVCGWVESLHACVGDVAFSLMYMNIFSPYVLLWVGLVFAMHSLS